MNAFENINEALRNGRLERLERCNRSVEEVEESEFEQAFMQAVINQRDNTFLHHLEQETAKAQAFARTIQARNLKENLNQLRNSEKYQQLSLLMKSAPFQALVAYFEPLMSQLPTASKHKPVPVRDDVLANFLALCVLSLEPKREKASFCEKAYFPVQDIYQCLSDLLAKQKVQQNPEPSNL